MSLLTDASDRFKADLLADDVAARQRLVGVYGSAYQRLAPEVERVARKIERARQAGDAPSQAWLYRVGRLSQLQEQAAREMADFGGQAEDLITRAQRQTAERGGQEAEELTRISLGEIGSRVDWNRVPKEALKDLVGNLSDGSPLSDLFNQYGPDAATALKDTLTSGLVAGWNPIRIATHFRENMAGNLNRALVVARTETLRVYRESTRRSFIENSDVVNGWVWLATLTTRTCPCCWAMNGTHHGNEETLDGHPSCRCCMVPSTKSAKELGLGDATTSPADDIPSGESVFADLSDLDKRAILGDRGYQLYANGQVSLSDFVGRKENRAWGSMRYVLSPGQALAKAAAVTTEASMAALDPEAARLRANMASKISNTRKALRKEGWPEEKINEFVKEKFPEYFKEVGPAPGIVGPGPIGPPPVQPVIAERDELTRQYFSKPAKLIYDPGQSLEDLIKYGRETLGRELTEAEIAQYRKLVKPALTEGEVTKLSNELFGRELSKDEFARLAGMPSDGAVTLSIEDGQFVLKGTSEFVSRLERQIYRDPAGNVVMHQEALYLKANAPKGMGTRIFATQVREATSVGIKSLVTEAKGYLGAPENGYYTWARLGYNKNLGPMVRQAALEAGLGEVKTLHDVMSTEGGAAWWKANGKTFTGTFDLAEGSTSRKVLADYLELRNVHLIEEAAARSLSTEAVSDLQNVLAHGLKSDAEKLIVRNLDTGKLLVGEVSEGSTTIGLSPAQKKELEDFSRTSVVHNHPLLPGEAELRSFSLDDFSQFGDTAGLREAHIIGVDGTVHSIYVPEGMTLDTRLARKIQTSFGGIKVDILDEAEWANTSKVARYNEAIARSVREHGLEFQVSKIEAAITDGWKPVMTREEAKAWATDSTYKSTTFHVTSPTAKAAIESEGFALKAKQFGKVWGDGVYLAADEDVAAYYARQAKYNNFIPETIETQINVKKVFTHEVAADPALKKDPFFNAYLGGKPPHPLDILEKVPGGKARYEELHSAWIKAGSPGGAAVYPEGKFVAQVLQEHGYDALYVVDLSGITDSIGGSQLIVFDPRNITVIEEAVAPAVVEPIISQPVVSVGRDDLTKQHFNDKFNVVHKAGQGKGDWKKASKEIFGRELTDTEFGRLVGAMDGSEVTVITHRFNGKHSFNIEVDHKLFVSKSSRAVSVNSATGKLGMTMTNIELKGSAPAGLGTRILAHTVEQASELGIRGLGTLAADGAGFNGYYTWPRLGYNLNFEAFPKVMAGLEEAGFPATVVDTHELFKLPGGAEWWKANGVGGRARFDLAEGSTSRKVLDEYLKLRDVRITKAVVPVPVVVEPVVPQPVAQAFRKFASQAEADTWGIKHSEAYLKQATEAEKAAIGEYTGNKFTYVNRWLRMPEKTAPGAIELAKPIVEQLDKAMVKSVLKEAVTTYRGVQDASWAARFDQLKAGEVLEDLGYQSTSLNKEMSKAWVAGQPDAVLVELRAPAGTRAIFMTDEISASPGQSELLLDRGQKMRVVSTEVKDGVKHLVVEVVPTEGIVPVIAEPLPPPVVPQPLPPLMPKPVIVPPTPVPGELDPKEVARLKANAASRVSKMRAKLKKEGMAEEEIEKTVRKLVPEHFGGTGVINPQPVKLPQVVRPVIAEPIKPPSVVKPPEIVRKPGLEPLKPPPAGGPVGQRHPEVQRFWIKQKLGEGYSVEEIALVGQVQPAIIKETQLAMEREAVETAAKKAAAAAARPAPLMRGKEARQKIENAAAHLADDIKRATADVKEKQDLIDQLHKRMDKMKMPSSELDQARIDLKDLMDKRAPFNAHLRELKAQATDATAEIIETLFPDKGKADIVANFGPMDVPRKPYLKRAVEAAKEGLERFSEMIGPGRVDGKAVNVGIADTGRESYRAGGNLMALNQKGSELKIIVHEMGHWLEEHEPESRVLVQDFYRRRTQGESARKFNDLFGTKIFRDDEITKVDNFADAYMGKVYKGGATEILSMGLEWMMSKPAALAEADPEMFDLIYDIIQGAHLQ